MTFEIGYKDVQTPEQPPKVGEIEASSPRAAIDEWIGEGRDEGWYFARLKKKEDERSDKWECYRFSSGELTPC